MPVYKKEACAFPPAAGAEDLAAIDSARSQPAPGTPRGAMQVRQERDQVAQRSWEGEQSEELLSNSWPVQHNQQGQLRARSTLGNGEPEYRTCTEPSWASMNSAAPCKGHRQGEPVNWRQPANRQRESRSGELEVVPQGTPGLSTLPQYGGLN